MAAETPNFTTYPSTLRGLVRCQHTYIQTSIHFNYLYLSHSALPLSSTGVVSRQSSRRIAEEICISKYIRIEVKDNGRGIDPALVCTLFELGKSHETSMYQGLKAAAFIVKSQGGHLGAYSPGVGAGSIFYVDLPLLDCAQDGRKYNVIGKLSISFSVVSLFFFLLLLIIYSIWHPLLSLSFIFSVTLTQ